MLPKDKSAPFDFVLMQKRAKELIRAGKMPSADEFLEAFDQARQKYSHLIVKARAMTPLPSERTMADAEDESV